MSINFAEGNYQSHMERWGAWKNDGSAVDGSSMKSVLGGEIGLYHGGRESLLRKKQCVRGREKRQAGAKDQPVGIGFDTEEAIDAAVRSIIRLYPEHGLVLLEAFTSSGSASTRAKRVGLSYSNYRRKLSEAEKMVVIFMNALKMQLVESINHSGN